MSESGRARKDEGLCGHGALFIAAAELEYIELAHFIAKQALCLHLAFRVLNFITNKSILILPVSLLVNFEPRTQAFKCDNDKQAVTGSVMLRASNERDEASCCVCLRHAQANLRHDAASWAAPAITTAYPSHDQSFDVRFALCRPLNRSACADMPDEPLESRLT